jgi:CBS domain containing-hemolysin-like protein
LSDVLLLVSAVALMLVGSFLCSGVEAALLTVSPVKVHELARQERPVKGARRLELLRQKLGRTLAVLVIANNVFNIFGSLMVGGYAASVFATHVRDYTPTSTTTSPRPMTSSSPMPATTSSMTAPLPYLLPTLVV